MFPRLGYLHMFSQRALSEIVRSHGEHRYYIFYSAGGSSKVSRVSHDGERKRTRNRKNIDSKAKRNETREKKEKRIARRVKKVVPVKRVSK